MFKKKFNFGIFADKGTPIVHNNDLYSNDKGYGFLTEKNKSEDDYLKIPELNNGFDIIDWYSGYELTKILEDKNGCFINNDEGIPLTFKVNVPHQGNYNVTIGINGGPSGCKNIMIFTESRRLMAKDIEISPKENFEFECTVNVCDIIPRGKEAPFKDRTIDITVVGKCPRITYIEIKEVKTPTIYIAGDSTVTDQTGTYPYDPGTCYSGWAQCLPYFFQKGIAISNHAHSGLTTESFRSEGHYNIVSDLIKPGDFFMMQFAHNDQKLNHLKANLGYRENIIQYIREIQEIGAFPIIITPLCRNTWKGIDGTYHDMLSEYAMECIKIGRELNVPVIDLHSDSFDLIKSLGLEKTKTYFYPNDFTHTNDYGAFKMASFVADGCMNILELKDYVLIQGNEWTPPEHIELPRPPKELEKEHITSKVCIRVDVNFKDIEDCTEQYKIIELTSVGIIPNGSEYFRPKDGITRVEAIEIIMKIANFFATNVYNDMFHDVIGHEWYAGLVECAWSNGMIDENLIVNHMFQPNKNLTYEELLSLCINGYSSRKTIPDYKNIEVLGYSYWAIRYIKASKALGIYIDYDLKKVINREEATSIFYKLWKCMN